MPPLSRRHHVERCDLLGKLKDAVQGLLFQVVDDILDVSQSTEDLEKMVGKDPVIDETTYLR